MADLKNQYKQFTDKVESYYTVDKARSDEKRIKKEKSQNNFEKKKADAFSTLNEWGNTAEGVTDDFKKQMQAFKENQLDAITKLFLITDSKATQQNPKGNSTQNKKPNYGKKTVDTLTSCYNNAILATKSRIPEIFAKEVISTLGCSEEQTYDVSPLYIKVESIDLFKILKEDPSSQPGVLYYESQTTPNGSIPYSMDRELYNRLGNVGQSFNTQYGSNYIGASSNQLFDIEYVTIDGNGNPGNFYKVTMNSRVNNINKVTDFLVDYYSSIEMLNLDVFITNVLNLLLGAFSFKLNIGVDQLRDQTKFEKILQRVLGLCFDQTEEIDVSGNAKLSVLDLIDESFFELNSTELKEIDEKINNIKRGVVEFTDCNNVKVPVNYDATLKYAQDAMGQSNDTDKLNALADAINGLSQDENWKLLLPNIDIDGSVKFDFLKQIPIALMMTILSPKVLLGLMMLVKALKNNIADFVEDLNSFLSAFKDLIIQTMSKIGAIFVEELVKQIKKNIKRLVQNISIDIIKESKDARIRIITSLIATALTVAQLVRDYRRCKSVIDELIYLLKIVRANFSQSQLPTFSLALSAGLPGMSQTRAFSNVIEEMQKSGLPTGDLPDGSPNLMLQSKLSDLNGFFKEMQENGKTEIFIPPLTITPAGVTLPSKGFGKSY
jgi:hypothetical protein